MGVITRLEVQVRHKDRVNLYIDDEFVAGITLDTAVKNGLKIGKDVDEITLKEMIFDSEKLSAINKVSNYMKNSIKTEKQIKDYLYKKGYEKEVCVAVIDKLKEYRYLDDKQYVNSYIATYKNKFGARRLKEKLKQKGIKDENLDVLDDVEVDMNVLESVAKKYMAHKEKTQENYNKLYRFLAMRGYDFDDINVCVNNLKRDGEC